jgi:hypothetical protein
LWVVLTSLFSWLAYGVFLVVTRAPKDTAASEKR